MASRLPSGPPESSPPENTRLALIEAGLRLFGSKGFDAASTREIAAAAKANIAAIAYHFGGKAGLRTACAEHVAGLVREIVGPGIVGPIVAAADQSGEPTAAEAESRLLAAIEAMVGFIVARADAEPIANFVLREQMERSPAFEIIYASTMAPMHARICALWAAATGIEADSVEARLTTLSLIGQVIYFRIARYAVMRRLDWSEIGPAEAALISRTIKTNLRAALAAAREQRHDH